MWKEFQTLVSVSNMQVLIESAASSGKRFHHKLHKIVLSYRTLKPPTSHQHLISACTRSGARWNCTINQHEGKATINRNSNAVTKQHQAFQQFAFEVESVEASMSKKSKWMWHGFGFSFVKRRSFLGFYWTCLRFGFPHVKWRTLKRKYFMVSGAFNREGYLHPEARWILSHSTFNFELCFLLWSLDKCKYFDLKTFWTKV